MSKSKKSAALLAIMLVVPFGGALSTAATADSARGLEGRLVTAEEMPRVNDTGESWRTVRTDDGQGPRRISYCMSSRLGQLDAEDVAHRYFAWGPEDSTVRGANVVARFDTKRDARRALRTIWEEADACNKRFEEASKRPEPVTLKGRPYGFKYRVAVSRNDAALIEFTGALRAGKRISLVTWKFEGQDYTGQEDAIDRTMRRSAAQLS
jgi:hypothetical protein